MLWRKAWLNESATQKKGLPNSRLCEKKKARTFGQSHWPRHPREHIATITGLLISFFYQHVYHQNGVGAAGFRDASAGVELREIPATAVSRSLLFLFLDIFF